MTTTEKAVFVPGVWGLFGDGAGYWLNEGGQSAAGAAIVVRASSGSGRKRVNRPKPPPFRLPVWLADRVLAQVASPSGGAAG